MNQPRFIHLRVHSDYSMIDGISKIRDLVERARNLGMPALAITDFNNLFGLLNFYNSAHSAGIKPIIGADFYMKSKELGSELAEITVLAANNEGYNNLKMLISRSYQSGYSGKNPMINRDWLREHRLGLILLSGAGMGEFGKFLLRKNNKKIYQCLHFYQRYFPDNYYIELIRTNRYKEDRYIHAAVSFSIKNNLPVVATNDVRFLFKEDFYAHEIRVAIHDGLLMEDPKRKKKYSAQQYMCSENYMCQLFSDIPEALLNSVEIAKRCNVTLPFSNYLLPPFPTGERTHEDLLVVHSKKGLEERLKFLFPEVSLRVLRRQEYEKRLDMELKIINNMGFPGYFLIVMEFIQWSKENNIPVGPGRGSGPGSLVAYSLKITDIDPLEFDLLFERFLNKERISMPDFDIDFCMEKRDQVIEHVADMYGRDAVSQIITFGTMAAKAVIRDVGRVLGHPYSFVDRISKLVPSDPGMTLEKSMAVEPPLLELYKKDKEVQALIDIARKLEGVTRNVSKHAGGLVIAPTKITDFAPLYCDSDGSNPVTQWDKNDVEYFGLVKFDFLGLRTLTIIDWALDMVNSRHAKNGRERINISSIPLDEKHIFHMLQRSETTAVFQLESRGMKDLIKRLQPECLEDMIALVALFRPGPLQSGLVDNFLSRKHGREKISYPDVLWQHEILKPVLKKTYGLILYQEQVMQIAQVFSGYTLGCADMLRRAIAKKNPEEMAQQREAFKEGSKKKGINKKLSIKIFDLVEKFAGYGFNKSHSAAYALISYQTIWIKYNYPAEFMAAVMSADMENTDKLVLLVEECWRMGIKILPPDINRSLYYFQVNDYGEIIYGIGAIKGIGKRVIQAIINARHKCKKNFFQDLFDLCSRVDRKKLKRSTIEKFILSGALDCFGTHRAVLMKSLHDALKAADQKNQSEYFGQGDMFGVFSVAPDEVKKYYSEKLVSQFSLNVMLDGEYDTLGFYLTGHPTTKYIKEMEYYTNCTSMKETKKTARGKMTTVVGIIFFIRFVVTKSGKSMGIFTIEDRSGRIELILFDKILEKYPHLLKNKSILIAIGKVKFNEFSGGMKMIANKLMNISEARAKYTKCIYLFLINNQIEKKFLQNIIQLLEPYGSGNLPVYLFYKKKNTIARLHLGETWFLVTPTDHFLIELRNLVGKEQVELTFY